MHFLLKRMAHSLLIIFLWAIKRELTGSKTYISIKRTLTNVCSPPQIYIYIYINYRTLYRPETTDEDNFNFIFNRLFTSISNTLSLKTIKMTMESNH